MTVSTISKSNVSGAGSKSEKEEATLLQHVRQLREELEQTEALTRHLKLEAVQPIELLQEASRLVVALGELSSKLMVTFLDTAKDGRVRSRAKVLARRDESGSETDDAPPSEREDLIAAATVKEAPGARAIRPTEAEATLHAQRAKVIEREMLGSAAFCEEMGWTRQALSKAVKSHRVFFVERQGTRYFPAFFAWDALSRSQLQTVCKRLGELSGWEKWQFFTTPKGSLGCQTPLEALKSGQYKETLTAADGFAAR